MTIEKVSSTQLTIDLGALADNYRFLQSQVGPACRLAGIVKANAYGLGVAEIVGVLERKNCPIYFVATMDEAVALRALTEKPVAVLNGILPGDERTAISENLTPVINSLASLDLWRGAAAREGRALPAILHVDTGMNRLGLGPNETDILLNDRARLGGLDLKYIMSHFACADEEYPLNAQQAARFAAIRAAFPDVPASLANSAGIFLGADVHYDLARPGMALYGLNPTPDRPNPMRPVVRLDAPILQVRRASAGDTVGYGATHRLTRDTTLATVAIGYADGFLRSLSGRGTLYYKDQPCPILGRVSMDLTIVDLGDAQPQAGETLEVLGPHQSADDLAAAAGTIGYEILTNLGSRYRRFYQA